MTEQELKEIFDLLERSGMTPQLCDTSVPYYENEVPAGIPIAPGDIVKGGYIMQPRSCGVWRCRVSLCLPVFLCLTLNTATFRKMNMNKAEDYRVSENFMERPKSRVVVG